MRENKEKDGSTNHTGVSVDLSFFFSAARLPRLDVHAVCECFTSAHLTLASFFYLFSSCAVCTYWFVGGSFLLAFGRCPKIRLNRGFSLLLARQKPSRFRQNLSLSPLNQLSLFAFASVYYRCHAPSWHCWHLSPPVRQPAVSKKVGQDLAERQPLCFFFLACPHPIIFFFPPPVRSSAC